MGLTAAEVLTGLQRLFPHYGSSFYAKGKVVKRDPPPSPATVVLDLIRKCSFGCAFCFASRTLSRGDWTTLVKLDPLLATLGGLPKITLIGGEPFEHPEIQAVLDSLWGVVEEEIEIFTNGAAIPENVQAAERWVKKLTRRKRLARLRLTLAIDLWHKANHGTERFEQLIETLLALEAEGLIKAMFNVTDRRIYTHDYLDLPSIRETLGELAPMLWRHFDSLIDRRRVEDSFYLNPLIVQGRQAEEAGTEMLRAVDFLFHPEVVVTEREGSLVAASALNAVWMDPMPEPLVIGELTPATAAGRFLDEVVGRRLDFERRPWWRPVFAAFVSTGKERRENLKKAERLCRGSEADDPAFGPACRLLAEGADADATPWFEAARLYADFRVFLEDPLQIFERLADYVLALLTDPASRDLALDLSGRPDFDKFRLPVLRRVVERLSESGIDLDLFHQPKRLWAALVEGGGRKTPILKSGQRTLGHLPRADSLPVPLANTSLQTGFAAWPDPRAQYTVRLRLRFRPGEPPDYAPDGVEAAPTGRTREQGLRDIRRLLSFWDCMYGALAPHLRSVLKGKGDSEWKGRLNDLLDAPLSDPLAEPSFRFSWNLTEVFEYLSFDPNRNRAAYDNLPLLKLLVDFDGYKEYEPGEVARFKDSLHYWLRRAGGGVM